ncbi:MAG: hypothetical protein ABI977_28430 [Acidobacteriota bacterium]
MTRKMSRLRTVPGELREGEKFIETRPKFGYRFWAAVTQKMTVIPPQFVFFALLPILLLCRVIELTLIHS